jgi:UDP:flavonoid glycosyltransferase YjiC (YdhE family)
MKVLMTPVGSAGDVNPFVIIGRELRRRGHRVTLVAPAVFGDVAANAGLEFAAVGTAEEFERTTRNPDLWHPRRGARLVFRALGEQLRNAYAVLEELYEPGQTMLVGHSLSLFTRTFEERHPVPAATVHLAPTVFRSDFEQSVLPSGQDITRWPPWLKHALWWTVDRVAIDPMIAPALNAWRADLGLPPITRVFGAWLHSPQRVLGLFPDWFAQAQPDWPAQVRLTGFVLSDEICAPTDAGRDVRFMADADAPIVFTPGSANRHAGPFFQAGIEAAGTIGRRALLVTGYPDRLPSPLPPHVRHVRYASFSTLFPRAAAVVHHGGIGTCAQGLAAGAPQLIMPMGFDQPDNAARLARLGVGEALPAARFTAASVAGALNRLLSSRSVSSACQRWRGQIDGATALSRACELLEEQFDVFSRRRPVPAKA